MMSSVAPDGVMNWDVSSVGGREAVLRPCSQHQSVLAGLRQL